MATATKTRQAPPDIHRAALDIDYFADIDTSLTGPDKAAFRTAVDTEYARITVSQRPTELDLRLRRIHRAHRAAKTGA